MMATTRKLSGLRRGAQFQHHDGDDDGDHAVAKSFQATGCHFSVGHDENLAWRKNYFRFQISD
jgi:hypothetical protein